VLLIILYGFNKLTAFGTFFSLFGGLLLGWSLQAPLSGLVAWFLVCLKRSIRQGDRVQFPDLNLTGDIEDIGAMYLTLNQVGGSIASEEAVGRRVLIPNAMLFSKVAINYTVAQETAYILDEVVVRITYNSDLIYVIMVYILDCAIKQKFRIELKIAYNIKKKIFENIQKTPSV